MTDITPQADQDAAARREADRRKFRAVHDGDEVTVRAVQVVTDPAELEALERGEVPDGIQAQLDQQLAEDAAISAIEIAEGRQ